jgi:hypothetical protein
MGDIVGIAHAAVALPITPNAAFHVAAMIGDDLLDPANAYLQPLQAFGNHLPVAVLQHLQR